MKLFGFLSVYGLLIAAGIVAALLYMRSQEERLSLPAGISLDAVLWAVPIGIVGARLYYCAFTWERYAAEPLSVLRVWEGGLAIYGGLIGGLLGLALLAGRKKVSFLSLLDLVCPGVLLAQGIGRWGNFVNQEAYGAPVTDPGLQFFPYAVRVSAQWFQASFFYEPLWDILAFLALHFLGRKLRRKGDLCLMYFLVYALGRVWIEGLRSDSLMWGSVRVSQALSLALILVCGALLAVREVSAGRRS